MGFATLRHHRCSLPLVANVFEEARWIANPSPLQTTGGERRDPMSFLRFATIGGEANSLESRYANPIGSEPKVANTYGGEGSEVGCGGYAKLTRIMCNVHL